jgi:hypothetical protein
MFVGAVSIVDHPVIIVGLNRELEWREGVVTPHVRRVIELPIAVNEYRPASQRPARLAQVVNIRLEPERERKTGKWIGSALLLSVVILSVIAGMTQSRPQLNAADDVSAVMAKLGRPAGERTKVVNGTFYRVLNYPSRHYSVVLAGETRETAHYVGIVAGADTTSRQR